MEIQNFQLMQELDKFVLVVVLRMARMVNVQQD